MTDPHTLETLDQLVQAARSAAAAVKADPHAPVGEVLDAVTLTVTSMHLMLADGGLLTRIANQLTVDQVQTRDLYHQFVWLEFGLERIVDRASLTSAPQVVAS